MESKNSKSARPETHLLEVPADDDSPKQPLLPRTEMEGKPKHERPGESIMKSDDPQTAALRAWAEDKQTQVPGSNGSFALGAISGGVGAVSGGPMFLPRKEFNVEPPHHSVDHGPVEQLSHDEQGDGKKKRHSISNLFKRKGSESKTDVNEGAAKHDDGEAKEKKGIVSSMFHRKDKEDHGKGSSENEAHEDTVR